MEADERLAVKKALDALSIAERQYTVRTVGFLDPHEAAIIEREIFGKVPPDILYEFNGGYGEAERRMFICYPEYSEVEYSDLISVIKITGRDISELKHRDFLGSLMGLGIKRENIGDIVPLNDMCYIFLRPAMRDYVIENLTKIGRCGVRAAAQNLSEVVVPPKPVKPISATVSSLRLDCVLSSALNVSRSKAAELIRSERVRVNFEPVSSSSLNIKCGDLISVRNYGRYKLSEIRGMTRKGRQSVIIDKYI